LIYLSVDQKHKQSFIMIKKIHNLFFGFVFSISLFTSPSAKAQLTTSTALTPTQLVQNVLLGGGVTATNIIYNGDPSAIGSFNGTASNIGLPAGVIMASGDVSNAVGPNNIGSQSTDFGTSSSDPDLTSIASGSLNDAAILEFDFIPQSDTVKFRYVFGSEEYPEFVGSFNDIFGFFISGPNPAGGTYSAQNIALIPGTSTPISIDNVNNGSNDCSFGGPSGPCTNCSYYFDNCTGTSVQYDGFTVPLTAIAPVLCGHTYHIKIAIADVGDGAYDSGVFLEAGSFASAGSVSLSSGTNFGGTIAGNDSTIYEGCGFASLLVNRGTANNTNAETYYYALGGTATNGIDYAPLDDSVHFAAGQDSAYVIVNSLADAQIEGTETVTLSLFVTTPCGGSDTLTKTIYIVDSPPLKVRINDDTSLVCPPQNLFLTAHTFGGVAIGGYKYSWTNATGIGDTVHIHPTATTTYVVTVTDSCGNTATDTSVVHFIPYTPLQMVFSNDTTICGGNKVLLHSVVTNGLPNYNYSWIPNISTQDTVTVFPATTATYSLKVTDGCGYSISDTMSVTVYPISAAFQYSFTTNQTVAFSNHSNGAISYHWNFGDGSSDSISTSESPEHFYQNDGTYTVTLISKNQNGCVDTTVHSLVIIPDSYFYFPNAFSPNKNGRNDVFTGYGAGIKSYRMRIFDRWGLLVFESSDINTGWDGTYKGVDAPSDSYICVFDIESFGDKHTRRMGTVILLR
jgi:gliding motility-associated-like protein